MGIATLASSSPRAQAPLRDLITAAGGTIVNEWTAETNSITIVVNGVQRTIYLNDYQVVNGTTIMSAAEFDRLVSGRMLYRDPRTGRTWIGESTVSTNITKNRITTTVVTRVNGLVKNVETRKVRNTRPDLMYYTPPKENAPVVVDDPPFDYYTADPKVQGRYIADYLTKTLGFSKEVAAALMGNMWYEVWDHAFSTTEGNFEYGPYGLIQWTDSYERLAALKAFAGENHWRVDVQLDFIKYEIEGNVKDDDRGYFEWDHIKGSIDLRVVSDTITRKYVGPTVEIDGVQVVPQETLDARHKQADFFLKVYFR